MRLYKCLGLIICLLCSACEKDEYSFDEYRPIEIESSNVDFEAINNGFLLTATVPCDETTISLLPECRNQNCPEVTSVAINGQFVVEPGTYNGDYSFLDDQLVLSGGWGAISYVLNQNEYTINIRLNANEAHVPRIVQIQLGYGYEYVVLEITQLSNADADIK